METPTKDYTQITALEFEGIDYSDYPDFCDAHIVSAEWDSGEQLTDEEIDELNSEHRDIVYEKVMNYLN